VRGTYREYAEDMENTLTLPYALTKQIIQRAGGNPFFIEEVVRSLFDQGAIVRREGRLEVTEKINKIPLPNTINDLLMARIDRLEEKTRDLLKVASVIGRSFFYRILSDVASEVEDIPGKLSILSELQLLQAQSGWERSSIFSGTHWLRRPPTSPCSPQAERTPFKGGTLHRKDIQGKSP